MTHWHNYWSRDYTYHYMELFLQVMNKKLKGFYFFKEIVLLKENNLFTMYTPEKDKEKFHALLLKKYTTKHKDLQKLTKTFNAHGKKYYQSAHTVMNIHLKQCGNERLSALLKQYYDAWFEYTHYLWMVFNLGEAFCPQAIALITTKAQQCGKTEYLQKYLAFMAAPSQRCSVLVLNDTILELKQEKKNIDVKKLFKEFQWIPWGDLQAHPWTLEDIEKYVESHAVSEEPPIDFSIIKKDLQLTNKEIEMVQISKDLAYLRDLRDDYRRRAVFEIHFLYEEIARRCEVDYYNELMYYTTPELYGLLEGKKLSPQELILRKGDCMLTLEKGKFKVIPRNKAQKYFDKIHKEEGIHEIKGLAAQQGIVRGRAKIIRLDKELNKIERGDIMVAVTTHPEYITKMQIAQAIVTDEGGITCHAAIVAREMGIPCIVGTKNATQILKDGDLIEVNATKGIVRKCSG